MSLDHAAEILSWGPVADLDPHRLHVWLQVWRVVSVIGTRRTLMAGSAAKLRLNATENASLAEMARDLDEMRAARTGR